MTCLFVIARIVEEGTMSGRAKLVLRDLDPEDSGMYMCTAENDGGVVEGVADISVQGNDNCLNNN